MKKLKFLVGAVALFALVAVNVWNAATVVGASELGIADVEATAQMEEEDYLVWNGIGWVEYGLYWKETKCEYDEGMSSFYHTETCLNEIYYPGYIQCHNPGQTRAWAITVGID